MRLENLPYLTDIDDGHPVRRGVMAVTGSGALSGTPAPA